MTGNTDVLGTWYSVHGTPYRGHGLNHNRRTRYLVRGTATRPLPTGTCRPVVPGPRSVLTRSPSVSCGRSNGSQVPMASRRVALPGTRYRVRLLWLWSCTRYGVPGTNYVRCRSAREPGASASRQSVPPVTPYGLLPRPDVPRIVCGDGAFGFTRTLFAGIPTYT
jgi:hypothetical protein